MQFENIEPDFNIYIKQRNFFFNPTSFYNDDMDWRILTDDDDNTFLELPKGKYVSLNLNNIMDRDDRDVYWAGAYLINAIEFKILEDYDIEKLYILSTGFYNESIGRYEQIVFEYDKINKKGNRIILLMARPILSTEIFLCPVYKGNNPLKIMEIRYLPMTISDSFAKGGIINDNGLRLRKSNNLNAEIIKTLNKNEIVTVLDISPYREKIDDMYEHWYKIKTKDNFIGWVYGYYLDHNIPNTVHYNRIITIDEFNGMIKK